MKWIIGLSMFLMGCAPQVQEILSDNSELARKLNDQQELVMKLESERNTALEELDITNADIQRLITDIDVLNNKGTPSPIVKTVTKVVPVVEKQVVEVVKTVPDGSMTAVEEQAQYQEVLRVQEELETQRSRASELQQQIEAAKVLIDQFNNPMDKYGWPSLISAVLTILGFITGRKWKKN